MNRKVRDLMHRGIFTCFPDTPIQEAARMMVDHDISALVVIDESERMLGLLSRTDLVKLRLLTPDKERWRELPVENIMIKNVVQVDIDDTLHQASEIIMSRHIHRVVVTEETEDGSRKAVGILSITDIARDMAL